MEDVLKVNTSNYSVLVDKMHDLSQSHSTSTIKNLYQNLNIGCKCQHKNKRQLLSNRIITFFNNECDKDFKDLVKKELNVKKIEIYCVDTNDLILTI